MKYALKSFEFLIAMSAACTGFAQTAELGAVQGQGFVSTTPRGVMTEIRKPEKAVAGNTYWNENWFPGKITFTNGQVLDDKPLRYDIESDIIEVKTEQKLMGIKGRSVKSFTAYNGSRQTHDVYVNADQYTENEIRKAGFFKILAEGEWSLLESMEVTYVKSNYNPVLGVGNEEPKYLKKIHYYIARGAEVFEVPNSKNKFLKLFHVPTANLAAFMKENDLSIKDAKDLQFIVEFLNKRGQ